MWDIARLRLGLVRCEQLAGFGAWLAGGFFEFMNLVLEFVDLALLSGDHLNKGQHQRALFRDRDLDAEDRNRTDFLGGAIAHALQRARSRYRQ